MLSPSLSPRRSKINLTAGCSGQSLIEVVVGLIFLVPVVIALVDLGYLAVAGTVAHNAAKDGARAAASNTSLTGAAAAVEAVQHQYFGSSPTGMYQSGTGLTLATGGPLAFSSTAPMVQVNATVTVKIPVPLPFIGNTRTFQASAVEAHVAFAPPVPGG